MYFQGTALLAQRLKIANDLHARSLRAPTMSDDELNQLRIDIKHVR